MIDISEEFSDIAFQNPYGARMILGNFPRIVAEPIKSAVRAFPAAAGIGVENKFPIEIRIQDSVNSVMKEPISHGCFMYIVRLRVIDAERCVSAVAVSFFGKVATKGNNIIGKPNGEFFDVFAAALASEEFAPCYKQVFHRNDIIIGMKKAGISSLSLSLSVAPRFSRESKRDICCG